jgi:hypothetical protein
MQGGAQALGATKHFQAQRRQAPLPILGQQRLHVGDPIEQPFPAGFCRSLCRSST